MQAATHHTFNFKELFDILRLCVLSTPKGTTHLPWEEILHGLDLVLVFIALVQPYLI